MKNLTKTLSISSIGAYALTTATTASAAFSDGWSNKPKPSGVATDLEATVLKITTWMLGAVIMLATLMIIWGGVQYITAGGNEDAVGTAKKTISYGIIGVVIAGLAYAMVMLVTTLLV